MNCRAATSSVTLDVDDIVLAPRALDRDDRIGAARQHRAGHDLDTLAARGQLERRHAGRLDADRVEVTRAGLPVAVRDRNAVHRDAIERWLIALGGDRLSQYPTRRGLERNRLAG